MIYIGADPGMNGAIAIIDNDNVVIHDLPCLEEKRIVTGHGKSYKFRQPDRRAIKELLQPYKGAIAAVELVHFDSRDSTNKTTAEILIRSQEILMTSMECLGISAIELLPTQWRQIAGSRGLGADEVKITDYACQLFPSVRAHLKRASNRAKSGFVYEHGRAEALLLAHTARLSHQKVITELLELLEVA